MVKINFISRTAIVLVPAFIVANILSAADHRGARQGDLDHKVDVQESHTYSDDGSKFYGQIVDKLQNHGLKLIKSTNYQDEIETLDTSNFYGRIALNILMFWTWSKHPFWVANGDYASVKKGGRIILVKGGPNVRYQPLKNTELIGKFNENTESYKKSFERHTWLILPPGHIGIAKKARKTLILEQGYHHLKDGEQFKESIDVSELLDKKGEVTWKNIGKATDLVFLNFAPGNPEDKLIIKDRQNSPQILGPGWYLFSRKIIIPNESKLLYAHQKEETSNLLLGDSGLDFVHHFSVIFPSEKAYNKKIRGKEHRSLTYPQFATKFVEEYDNITGHLRSKIASAIIQEKFAYRNENINLKKAKKIALKNTIEEIENDEYLKGFTGVKVIADFVQISRKKALVHFDEMRKGKYENQIESLNRERKRHDARLQYDTDMGKAKVRSLVNSNKKPKAMYKINKAKIKAHVTEKKSGGRRVLLTTDFDGDIMVDSDDEDETREGESDSSSDDSDSSDSETASDS